jgi:hypothetical protein
MDMRQRSIWCTIWIMGALLAIASLDSIPDPPAVDPHTVTVKVPGPKECAGSLCVQYETRSSPSLLAQFRTQGIVLAEDTEPDSPSTLIVETGQAADPSPPALVGRHLEQSA